MRSRSNLLVLLGIAFFVVGGVIVYLLTSDDGGGGSSAGGAGQVTIVVATDDVEPGALADELIAAGKLRTDEVAATAAPSGAVGSLNQLAGATFVQGFAAGQPITSIGLQLQSRTFEVPEGFDAVAVQLDFVGGAAGYVDAGDRINLYAALRSTLASPDLWRAELLLSNVEVLDVNLTIPPRRGTAPDSAGATAQRSSSSEITYLLALRPGDVEKVVWATEFEGLYASLTATDAAPAGPTPGRDLGNVLQD